VPIHPITCENVAGFAVPGSAAFSLSLRARGTKTRETPSQQPLHTIPAGALLQRLAFLEIRKHRAGYIDTRSETFALVTENSTRRPAASSGVFTTSRTRIPSGIRIRTATSFSVSRAVQQVLDTHRR
jgi:hypothetical protein